MYVDNAVQAIIQAAESASTIGQAYNLRDEGNETWRDFIEAMEKELGIGRSWSNISSKLAYGMGYISEKLYGLLRIKKRPLVTRHMVCMFTRDQGYSIDKIKKELGYSPEISFQEGIKRTVEWYKAEFLNADVMDS